MLISSIDCTMLWSRGTSLQQEEISMSVFHLSNAKASANITLNSAQLSMIATYITVSRPVYHCFCMNDMDLCRNRKWCPDFHMQRWVRWPLFQSQRLFWSWRCAWCVVFPFAASNGVCMNWTPATSSWCPALILLVQYFADDPALSLNYSNGTIFVYAVHVFIFLLEPGCCSATL